MSEGVRIRLFVAVLLPGQVKQAISETQNGLRRQLRDQAISWTKPEQFHLTLKFLGSVMESRTPELATVLDQTAARFGELQMRAVGAGCFPNAARPRVIWVGLDEASGNLCDLQKGIEEAVVPFTNEEPENRFHAHVTIARVKRTDRSASRLIADWSEGCRGRTFGEWRAGTIALMQSVLSPNGATYAVLHESALRSP